MHFFFAAKENGTYNYKLCILDEFIYYLVQFSYFGSTLFILAGVSEEPSVCVQPNRLVLIFFQLPGFVRHGLNALKK